MRRACVRAQFFGVMAQVFQNTAPPLQTARRVIRQCGGGTADEGGIDAADPIVNRPPETLDRGQRASERVRELCIGLAQQGSSSRRSQLLKKKRGGR